MRPNNALRAGDRRAHARARGALAAAAREKVERRGGELLAPGFIEFGSSDRVFTKAQIIEALRAEAPLLRSIEDWNVLLLARGVILATYRAAQYGAPEEIPIYSLRSSVWKPSSGRRRLLFHQGTPGPRA